MEDQAKSIDRWNRFRVRPGIVSVAAHGLVFLIAAGEFHRTPKIAPYKLPGTAHGVQLLTYYAAGSREQTTSDLASKAADKPKLVSSAHIAATKPAPEKAVAPNTEQGTGNAAQSGLGDGEISMALLTYFPHPKPDLSSLARGTQGDVILNAVIDEHGKISELTLLKGLGKPVDDQVIAAVRQWTYSPAKKNGLPVPSEQELHFHYERG
jgi:protein TonB